VYTSVRVFRLDCGLILLDCAHFEVACAKGIFTLEA
jgi:hypothetical protein